MNNSKTTDQLANENMARSKEMQKVLGDTFEDILEKSNADAIECSELKRDQSASTIDQDFVKDYEGDEDFYGDDEENQSGSASYTGEQKQYIGKGDWVDKKFGEHQYDHKGDVNYTNQNRTDASTINGNENLGQKEK